MIETGVVYGDMFKRLPQALITDGACLSARTYRTLAENAHALKGYGVRPLVVSETRDTAMVATAITTDIDFIDYFPPRVVADGYVTLVGRVRARRQGSCTSSPVVTFYCDVLPPVSHIDGTASVSDLATSAEVSVLSTTYLEYDFSLRLVRDAQGQAHVSVWGTADGAGASRQAEISDVQICVKHLVSDGEYRSPMAPRVTVWR